MNFIIFLDFHSARHRNVHAGHHRLLNLHHENTGTLVCRQSRLRRALAQLVASFRAGGALLLAQ